MATAKKSKNSRRINSIWEKGGKKYFGNYIFFRGVRKFQLESLTGSKGESFTSPQAAKDAGFAILN